jgi:NAD(P)-dependent dehydrogenase (short-subunit alcohol dehydrogenase family)
MANQALNGKTALVTGAGSGIGAACARLLAEDGATVLLMGRNHESLSKARAALTAQVPGARVEIFAGDACKEESVKAALERAHAIQGRLDILVPTVGGSDFRPLLMQTAATLVREFELNVVSVFHMVRHGVPLMEPGGAIVCFSSATVLQSMQGLVSYVSSKAALERFVRAAAHELGSAKIRINCVRAGLTRTLATSGLFESPALIEQFASATPLGRTGEPHDVALAVRFLAGPEAEWVTGQTISADGGQDQGAAPYLLDAIFGKEAMDKVRAGKPPQ